MYLYTYLFICMQQWNEGILAKTTSTLKPVVMGYKKKKMPEEYCENFIMPVPSVSSHWASMKFTHMY